MIVNKCIRQNWKILNHIRIQPVGFEMEADESKAEEIWNHLTNDELTRLVIYNRKDKNNKYTISLWTDNEYAYLIQVLRDEYNTDKTLVYMSQNTEDNINDLKSIAKFVHKNIKDIINHSIGGIHELNKLRDAAHADGDA